MSGFKSEFRGFPHRIKKLINEKLFVDVSRNFDNLVFIAGTGRSGTTWIAEILNHKNEYRYIFEPFHPYKVKIVKHFKYRQYLRPSNREHQFLKPVETILSGKNRSHWTDRFNRKIICRKRIIKDIRANLLLKWVKTNFPEIKLILLIRNPCAVANSKLNLNWDSHLDVFLSQKELMEDFLEPYGNDIKNTHNRFEEHIFQWCIENYVPLNQFRKNEIFIIFYEHLCINPEEELVKLFSFLNKPFKKDILTILSTPSLLSKKTSAIITGNDLISSWRKTITKEQIRKAIEILSIFNLDKLYQEETIPLLDSNMVL